MLFIEYVLNIVYQRCPGAFIVDFEKVLANRFKSHFGSVTKLGDCSNVSVMPSRFVSLRSVCDRWKSRPPFPLLTKLVLF